MAQIKAADVAKLRKMTGAGMMDCKKALGESNGDFDLAINILREKGQKIANKRADRDATEGAVIGKVSADGKKAALVVLNCETDFVAKNADFVKLATSFADAALDNNAKTIEEVKAVVVDGKTIEEHITFQTGVIGEKLDLSYVEVIEAAHAVAYIHPGNNLAAIVGFNVEGIDGTVARDVAMQVAAMNPISIDKDSVPQEVIDNEIAVGKEQARKEGKPEAILEKIAMGKLNKYFAENTLLNQSFVKDNKKSIGQYLKGENKELTVTIFKRFNLKG